MHKGRRDEYPDAFCIPGISDEFHSLTTDRGTLITHAPIDNSGAPLMLKYI